LLPSGQNDKNRVIDTFVDAPATEGKPNKKLFDQIRDVMRLQALHSADGTGVHRLDSPFDFVSQQNNQRLRVKASCGPPKATGQVAATTTPNSKNRRHPR
jgi:hypothetical protein